MKTNANLASAQSKLAKMMESLQRQDAIIAELKTLNITALGIVESMEFSDDD